MIHHNYAVGERIECRDPASGAWRPAWVVDLKPYRGRPGYEILWDDLKGIKLEPWQARPSSGGWTYEACMRRPKC